MKLLLFTLTFGITWCFTRASFADFGSPIEEISKMKQIAKIGKLGLCRSNQLPPLDIVFLIDVASTNSVAGWLKLSNLRQLLNANPSAPTFYNNSTKQALITYASTPKIVLNLNSCNSSQCFIQNANIMGTSDATRRLDIALTTARDSVFEPYGRPGAKKVIVLITDGLSAGSPNAIATNLKNQGVVIIAATSAFTSTALQNQLLSVVSPNLSGDLKIVKSYAQLYYGIPFWMWQLTCSLIPSSSIAPPTPPATKVPMVTTKTPPKTQGPTTAPVPKTTATMMPGQTTTMSPPMCPAPNAAVPTMNVTIDFIFVIDGSQDNYLSGGFTQIKNLLINTVLPKFNFNQASSRIALLLFNSNVTPVLFMSYSTSTAVVISQFNNNMQSIGGPGHNLQKALSGVNSLIILLDSGYRPNVKNVIFLIAAGDTGSDPSATAAGLRSKGFSIYGIGWGSKANMTQLQAISTNGQAQSVTDFTNPIQQAAAMNFIIAKACAPGT